MLCGIIFSFKFLSVFQIVEIVDDSFRVHFKKWADPQWDEWLELCSTLTVARVANHKTQSSGIFYYVLRKQCVKKFDVQQRVSFLNAQLLSRVCFNV